MTCRIDHLAALLRTRACLVTCITATLTCDAILARGTIPTADGVQSYLQMLSIWSGNVLLRHWVVATDDFLLTDLPFYLLASLVFGHRPLLLTLVPFAVFALMLATCLAIVHETVETTKGRRLGSYLVLLLLGVPWGDHFNDFFWSDYHVATVALCLVALLAAAPALSGRPIAHWRLAGFAILLFAAAFSDPLAVVLLSGPLIVTVLARTLTRSGGGRPEIHLAIATLAATAASFIVRDVFVRTGLLVMATSVTLDTVKSAAQFVSNLRTLAALSSIVMNGPAAFPPGAGTLPQLVGASRLITMLLVAATALRIAWHLPRDHGQGVAQCLVAGAAAMTLANATSQTFVRYLPTEWDGPGSPVRFAVPAVIFLCLAAALAAPPLLAGWRTTARRTAYAGLSGLALLYAAGGIPAVIASARQPSGLDRAPMRPFVEWLGKRGLTSGVGDYWMTQVVSALTGWQVKADAVRNVDGHLEQYRWLTDTSRFVGPNPQFVIYFGGSDSGVTPEAIEATYGKPRETVELLPNQFIACLADCPPLQPP